MLQLHEMFKEKVPEISFEEAEACIDGKQGGFGRFINRFFKIQPDDWYYENYFEHYKAIKDTEGIKVRIPLSDENIFSKIGPSPGSHAIDLARRFFLFADLVVFSPAPLWFCSYAHLATHPWPEFSRMHSGTPGSNGGAYYTGGIADFFALHAAMSPLFKRGKVAYLPHPGHEWSKTNLGFPKLHRVCSEEPAEIACNVLENLYVEQLVSESLGCYHVMPRTAHVPVITRHISTATRRDYSKPAHIIMHLQIPRIENATFSELCSIQEDEAESITEFKRSILDAANEASKLAITEEELIVAAKRIQSQLIEEPLHRLQSRLKKIESIRRRKWSSYAVLASSAALVATLQPELTNVLAGTIGGLSLFKIFDAYFADLEKNVTLSAEATYWITRLRDK